MPGNKSTAGNPARQIKVKSAHFWTLFTQVWRRGRDSNPRGIAPKLISSQPRYDHFDTSPCLSQHLTPEKHLGFWGELMGRTYLIFGFRSLRKPNEIKGSGVRRVHKGDTISSQPRYDHFDTSPCLSQHLTPEKHLGFWGELMGRTYMIFGFRSLRKPSKIKGSGPRRVHKGHTISSQPRYDLFDTSPYSIFVRTLIENR